MRHLPTDVLRTFVTISELGSFTKAGEVLARSQPAISLQIKRIEELLDTSLFVRNGPVLSLTPHGDILYSYAKQILTLNDEAITTFIQPRFRGTIHFGIPSEFASLLLPKIVRNFKQCYRHIMLEVTSDICRNLLSASNKNRFDIILALHDDPDSEVANFVKHDELVWVTGPQYAAHQKPTVPLVAAPQGCIYRNRATQALKAIDQPCRIVYTIPDLSGIQSAVAEGLGVTVLAKSTVPENLQIIKPSNKFPKLGKISISMVSREKEPNQAVARLIEYVQSSLS